MLPSFILTAAFSATMNRIGPILPNACLEPLMFFQLFTAQCANVMWFSAFLPQGSLDDHGHFIGVRVIVIQWVQLLAISSGVSQNECMYKSGERKWLSALIQPG